MAQWLPQLTAAEMSGRGCSHHTDPRSRVQDRKWAEIIRCDFLLQPPQIVSQLERKPSEPDLFRTSEIQTTVTSS